jgi:hypothetical protein
MNTIVAIVFLSGASCYSSVEQSEVLRMTLATKTPCAIILREPVANPFKAAQQPNPVAAVKPAATKPAVKPAYKYPPKKTKKKRKKRK